MIRNQVVKECYDHIPDKLRRAFISTIRNGEPRSIRYYVKASNMVLSHCKQEEIYELDPFSGNTSNLATAIWRIRAERYLNHDIK